MASMALIASKPAMQEEKAPTVAEPTNMTATFDFTWDNNSFLDAMAYFHLNRFQQYVHTELGLNNVANSSIPVDPQGLSRQDNSHLEGLRFRG
jgi:hypothetical protein